MIVLLVNRLTTVCLGELAATLREEDRLSPRRAAFGGGRFCRIGGLQHRAGGDRGGPPAAAERNDRRSGRCQILSVRRALAAGDGIFYARAIRDCSALLSRRR